MKNVKLFLGGLIASIIGFKCNTLLLVLGLEMLLFASLFAVVDWFKKGITIKIIDSNDKD